MWSRSILAAALTVLVQGAPTLALHVAPPESNLARGEQRITVTITAGSLSGAQAQIDNARGRQSLCDPRHPDETSR